MSGVTVGKHIYGALVLILCSLSLAAQTPQIQTEEILTNASQQAANYSEAFKNLLAEETKVFEAFDKSGGKKIKRTVRSTFIVYGLQNADGQIVEFRNVITVDGKPIGGAENRAQSFFEKVASAGNSARERQQLVDESLRYDPEIKLDGFTLFQAIPLAVNIRPALEFTRLPDETLDGRKVIVIAYKQIKPSSAIRTSTDVGDRSAETAMAFDLDLKIEPAGTERLRGTFWIDAETFQTRREIRELTAQPENFPASIVISKTELSYTDSLFSILTPATIVYTDYHLDKKNRVSIPDLRVTFTYSKFSRADVEVKSAEIK
jgi:hypothetical protein